MSLQGTGGLNFRRVGVPRIQTCMLAETDMLGRLFVGGRVVLLLQLKQVRCQVVPQGRQVPVTAGLQY